MPIKYLVLRNEYKKNEYRVALIPTDCKILINNNFIIYVESSKNRCFSDELYKNNGCIIIDDFTKYNFNKSQTLIIGLKELDYNNLELFCYKHLYFSHTFKDQSNSKEILQKFKIKEGLIYDLEYLIDDNNKRLVAFGFWAGFIGTALGLLQYYYKSINQNIENLKACDASSTLFEEVEYFKHFFRKVNTGIIGVNGRSGKGSRFLLERLGISNIHGYSRASDKDPLKQHNIIINCIKLSPEDNNIFISEETLPLFDKLSIIVDVSCDIYAKNNPICLKYQGTTFETPVHKISDKLDIIAIDNLPSLLPKDSSEEFSAKLQKIICEKWNNYSPKLGII